MTILRLNECSLSNTSLGEEWTYLLDWNTAPIHQKFLPMTFAFSKLKIDFEQKKISGHRITSGKCDGSLSVVKEVEFRKYLQQ